MPAISDRHEDAFDNPAKMACREGNLRVLREAAFLLWQDGDRARLRCNWCELMGATGLLTLSETLSPLMVAYQVFFLLRNHGPSA
jgi:hypothetical protein